jgi:hypothetical protein
VFVCRGVPTGYISSLEQRLLETELALYYVLTAPRGNAIVDGDAQGWKQAADSLRQFDAKQTRSEKLVDWQVYPLSNPSAQTQAWCRRRAEIVNSRQNGALSPVSAIGVTPQEVVVPQIRDFAVDGNRSAHVASPSLESLTRCVSNPEPVKAGQQQSSGVAWDKYF